MARIALVTSSFLPRVGGVEEHVRHVAADLQRRGHEVVVWSVDQGDVVPDEVDGVRIRYLPCPLPARTAGALLRFAGSVPAAWAAWEQARRLDRPDLLHVHCYGPNGVYATALARLHGLPLIYSHHGETFMDADHVFDTSALLRRSLSATLRQAAEVTSCSAYAAADLVRFGVTPGTVRVVFNGVDLTEPVGELPADLPAAYVAGIGRLVAVKGFDNLIRAFAQVASDQPELHLVIGGDGPERSTLTALASELGVGQRVRFTGTLARGQVGAVMAGALALVVPSQVEAFGITVLEGWRAATAVVATKVGGPPEFVRDGHTGLLVDPAEPVAIAASLRRLFVERGLRNRLAAFGRREVEKFTWSGVADSYEDLYRGVLAKSPQSAPLPDEPQPRD